MTDVGVGQNESFESLLKRFTRRVQQDSILAEVRRREHYEKPSVKRKRKGAAKRCKSRQGPETITILLSGAEGESRS